MNKAYSYIRFSSMKDFNPTKAISQLQDARDFASLNNLIFDDTFSFQDLGVSAFKGENKKTGKLGLFLYAVQKGVVKKGSYLLIENLDRLSRENARLALRTLEAICDEGITVVTMSDRKEYTSETLDKDPTDLLYSILIFIRGNEESQTKSRRISAAWERRIKDIRNGKTKATIGQVPCWLKFNGEDYLVLNDRVQVIKDMFQMSKVGMGCGMIANRLNQNSVPTFQGAKKWLSAHVIFLLRSQSVTGRLVPRKGKIVEGKKVYIELEPVHNFYPRIISERLWQTVQKGIDKRYIQYRAHKGIINNAPKNIFGHITQCQDCGGIMRRKKRNIMLTRQTETQAYLICDGAEFENKCQYNPVLYRPLHESFLKNGADMVANHYLSLLDKEAENGIDKNNIQRLLLEPKINDLKEAINKQGEDRAPLNLAVRNLFSKVIVRIEKGILEFHWAYGGISEFSYLDENNNYIEYLISKLKIK